MQTECVSILYICIQKSIKYLPWNHNCQIYIDIIYANAFDLKMNFKLAVIRVHIYQWTLIMIVLIALGLRYFLHKILSGTLCVDKSIFDDDDPTMNLGHLLNIESIDRF